MNAADCAERYFDPLLKQRHLALIAALQAAGIQATCSELGEWMVTMPSMRFYGWLSFAELEPPLDEWIVVIPRQGEAMRVVKRIPPEKGGWDMCNERHEVSCMNDYLFWMPKP